MNAYANIFPELKRCEPNLSMSIIFATTIWRTRSSLEKMKYVHTLHLSYLTSNFLFINNEPTKCIFSCPTKRNRFNIFLIVNRTMNL